MNCPDCGGWMEWNGEQWSTLVAYPSPKGHRHDDNCCSRFYICNDCGKKVGVSKQNTCWCGWKGKEECFCHEGKKVQEWP